MRARLSRQPAAPGARTYHAAKSAESHARRIAGLKRGNVVTAETRAANPEPPITLDLAEVFVKLCLSGVPPIEAVAMLAPGYTRAVKKKGTLEWLVKVQAHPYVVAALEQFCGGKWQDLEPEDRLTFALDKHYAELAYYLYTHAYEHADGLDLRKLDSARDAILLKVRGEDASSTGAFDAFLARLASGAVMSGPPQLPTEVQAAALGQPILPRSQRN